MNPGCFGRQRTCFAMNSYIKHIGDWRVATGKLTRVQRDIYAELIDTYYDKEVPLTGDFERLAEDQACRTDEERAALRYVLDRFFKPGNDSSGALSYTHDRCNEEITAFNRKSEVARANGRKGGLSPRATRKRNGSERLADGEAESSERQATPYPIPHTKKDSPDGESKESVAAAPPPPSPPDGEGGTAEPAEPPKPPLPPPPSPTAQTALAGLEPASPARPAKKCPKDFKVDTSMAMWAAKECPLLSVDEVMRETAMFRDHTFAKAITDWPGAWRNWLRREQKGREQRQPRGGRVERNAARDEFMDKLLNKQGDGNGQRGFEGALDVESRVVGDC